MGYLHGLQDERVARIEQFAAEVFVHCAQKLQLSTGLRQHHRVCERACVFVCVRACACACVCVFFVLAKLPSVTVDVRVRAWTSARVCACL